MITEAAIKNALNEGRMYSVELALCIVAEGQTSDELQSEATVEQNNIGFNAFDAKFGTDLYQQITAGNREISVGCYRRVSRLLTPKQRLSAGKMLAKYAKQIKSVVEGYQNVKV